jgi:hypothetical protein
MRVLLVKSIIIIIIDHLGVVTPNAIVNYLYFLCHLTLLGTGCCYSILLVNPLRFGGGSGLEENLGFRTLGSFRP